MKLTDRQIRTLQTGPGLHQSDYRDHQVRGLVLRVYKSGVRTWFVSYRRKDVRGLLRWIAGQRGAEQ
jgi:hypothetical protein